MTELTDEMLAELSASERAAIEMARIVIMAKFPEQEKGIAESYLTDERIRGVYRSLIHIDGPRSTADFVAMQKKLNADDDFMPRLRKRARLEAKEAKALHDKAVASWQAALDAKRGVK